MDMEVAVQRGDTWKLIDIRLPLKTLVAFEEEFGVSVPDSGETGHMWRHLAWMAHRADNPTVPLAEWMEGIDDMRVGEEAIDEIRDQLPRKPGDPVPLPVREPADQAAETEPGSPIPYTVSGGTS
jgi:hypothetical protein